MLRLIKKLEYLMQHLDMHPHLVPRNLFVGNRIPLAGRGASERDGAFRAATRRPPRSTSTVARTKSTTSTSWTAASFPSSGAVNPALTIMANALRVGDHILERLGANTAASTEVAQCSDSYSSSTSLSDRRSQLVFAAAMLVSARWLRHDAVNNRCGHRTNDCTVSAVDVVGMTVSDMDRAVAFYTGVLPFSKVSERELSGRPVRTA